MNVFFPSDRKLVKRLSYGSNVNSLLPRMQLLLIISVRQAFPSSSCFGEQDVKNTPLSRVAPRIHGKNNTRSRRFREAVNSLFLISPARTREDATAVAFRDGARRFSGRNASGRVGRRPAQEVDFEMAAERRLETFGVCGCLRDYRRQHEQAGSLPSGHVNIGKLRSSAHEGPASRERKRDIERTHLAVTGTSGRRALFHRTEKALDNA